MSKLVFLKLIKIIFIAFFATLLGLFLLLAQPAHAQGPVNIGDLPPGKVVTVTFRAAITTSLSAGTTQVCNQATISGTNFATFVTNDPTTPAANDPTCTPIDLPTISIAAGATPSETGPTDGSFILTISDPAPAGGLTVNYNLTGSTATLPADYSLAAGTNLSSLAASTFTIAAGEISATINIVPVNDQIDDDGETVQLNLAAGSGYTLGATTVASRTIIDDDTRGVILAQSGGSTDVTEGGATDTYTIRLNTVPTATVTITFSTGSQIDPITGLTFLADLTALNPQTVTVIASDDSAIEGNHTGTISHSASGGGYTGESIPNVTANITDNDIAYTLAANQVSVTEGNTGTTPISFTLTRTGDITRSSTVDFSLGGTATNAVDYNNVSPGSGTVNFGAGVTQTTLTMDVLGDFIDESNETIIVSLSNATGTNGSGTGTVSGSPASTTIIDDDSAGVTVTPTSLTISEPNFSDTFNIRLSSQPTATVTIGLSTTSDECSFPASVNLTNLNWDTGVTMTVTAVDDTISDGPQPCDIVTAPTSSTDPTYNNTFNPADVSVTVNDNDVADVSVSTGSVSVTEGGATAQYNIRLITIPTATVTISFNTGSQIDPIASLTFPADVTALDPQTITVTAVDDTVIEGDHSQIISHSASGGGYDGVTVPSVTAAITDNDIAYSLAANQVSVTEGNIGTTPISFTLTRSGDITRSSTVDFALSGTATNGTDYNNVSPAPGTVNSSAGQVSRTLTLDVLGDFVVEADETITVTLSAASGTNASGTGTIFGSPAGTEILNDDTAGVTVNPLNLTISEPNSADTFNIQLTSEPTATVTITLSTSSAECSLSASSISLTNLNWNTGVTTTVTAVDDFVSDGPQPCNVITSAASSSDPNYSGRVVADVAVTVNDNDVPGITITPTSGLTTTETGGTATFSMVLNTQPTSGVTLTLTSADTTEGTVAPASVSFTTANWNISRTITVTGVNDNVDDGNQPYTIVTNDPTSSDPNYNGAGANPADVSLTNLDDDTAGFIVSAISGNTSEDGITATFTIRLTSQPTATVTVSLTSSDLTEGTVSPALLTFTTLDWNIPHTATVTGVDDALTDGSVAYTSQTGPATSSDPGYNGLNPNDVSVVNLDNDGVTIYLPVIFKDFISAPDLVIDSLTATSNSITVVLRNQGTAPVVDAFWVDVYFNPSVTPSLNKRWQDIASHGAVWGVSGAGLSQLTPGGTLTLTRGGAYYFPQFSSPAPLPVGANVFALADSVNFSTSYGAVQESNEGNNLFGPIISTAGSGPLTAGQAESPSLAGLPDRE